MMLNGTKIVDGGLSGLNVERTFTALRTNVTAWHERAVLWAEITKNTKGLTKEEIQDATIGAKISKVNKQSALKAAQNFMLFCVKKRIDIENYISWFTFDQFDAGFSTPHLDGKKAYKAKIEVHVEHYIDTEAAIEAKKGGKARRTKSGSEAEGNSTKETNWVKTRGSAKRTNIVDRQAAYRTISLRITEQQWRLIWTINQFLKATLGTKFSADRKYSFTKSTKKLIIEVIRDYNPGAADRPWLVGHHGPMGTNHPNNKD